MSTVALSTALLDEGTPAINFFNGRLLTGRDLTREQAARRAGDQRLGHAIGTGVVSGFGITEAPDLSSAAAPVLTVGPGLAIAPSGETLALRHTIALALTAPTTNGSGATATLFAACEPLLGGVYVAGAGIYLLTVASAIGSEGRAPVSGLDPSSAHCNSDVWVETVQFRLLYLDAAKLGLTLPGSDATAESLFRSRLAARCLGTLDGSGDQAGDFDGTNADPLAAVVGAQLSDRDVPLAVLYWTTTGGVRFVDAWAARRRPATRGLDELDPIAAVGTAASLAEARLLQFNAHADALADLIGRRPAEINRDLGDLFAWVPPAGLVPAGGAGSARGLSPDVLFGARAMGSPTVIAAADAMRILRRSLLCAAVPVTAGTPLQLYWIEENLAPSGAAATRQLYLLFAARSVHGFLEKDAVATVLAETWQAYAALQRKSVVTVKLTAPEAALLVTALQATQSCIIQYAIGREALAAAQGLNDAAVRDSFRELYRLQKDLTATLLTTFANDPTLEGRTAFAIPLNTMLDVRLPSGGRALGPAVDSGTLMEIVAAQDAINHLVASFSGEFAFGGLRLPPAFAPQGTNIAPGAVVPFLFQIENRTDKHVEPTLAVEIVGATSGNWGGAARIVDQTVPPQPLASIPLNPDQVGTAQVLVTAPADGQLNQHITLRLTATLPPPNDESFSQEIELLTSDQPSDAVLWRLVPEVVMKPTGRTNANKDQTYTFQTGTRFTAAREPLSATVTIRVRCTFEGSAPTDWNIAVVGTANGVETAPNSRDFTYQVAMPRPDGGGIEQTRIHITPLQTASSSADRVCSFTVEATARIVDPTTNHANDIVGTASETPAVKQPRSA